MKKILITAGLLLQVICLFAQQLTNKGFELSGKRINLREPKDTAWKKRLGGVSGIELVNENVLQADFEEVPWKCAPRKSPGENKMVTLMVADHQEEKERQVSYAFTINNNNVLERIYRIRSKISWVESIRYNSALKRFFFCYENDTETGIGYLDGSSYHVIFREPIPSENTSANRGIEGISFSQDGQLWMAFESGGGTDCGTNKVVFNRMKVDAQNGIKLTLQRFYYDFEKCSCLLPPSGNQKKAPFSGGHGSGVSEILSLGSPDSLLVMERCFDSLNRKAKVKLYLATVQPSSDLLKKEPLLDVQSLLPFEDKQHNVREEPGNIEGLAWSEDIGGRAAITLLTDNNYSNTLKTMVMTVVLAPGLKKDH
ncbi:esterase-like activity of phytase family protein [Mucilaginibacter sp. 3215]|uniref:esterase-like activity of phytase family protein n=1 Tax=Mucilaginibacter sp. 3215 TaxID=3373912 RepID=UPI003D19B24D